MTLPSLARFVFGRRPGLIPLRDRIAYAPYLVQLVVTRRCNLRCGYCNEYDRTSGPVPWDDLVARVGRIRELGALALEFTGGEPLLHPRLVDLVRVATQHDFPRRMLISNALLLTDEAIAGLNDAGLTDLQVSVDGARANETTRKTLDTLRERLVRLAEQARFRVVVSAVVGACPPEETLETIDFARAHGLRPRVLLLHGRTGQLEPDATVAHDYRAAMARLGGRGREAGGYRDRLLAGRAAPFRCRAGSRYLYVDEHGDAHWCSQQAARFTRPLLEYGPADLAEQFHVPKGACADHCTLGCARTCSAPDAWRAQG
ncbi:MAG: radical SAM protein [Vicinamibacteria bacterium]|nr:radical SAM protein [Vicinamibacteria bacterium]